MAIVKAGYASDMLTVDPTSKAARAALYDAAGGRRPWQGRAKYWADDINSLPGTTLTVIIAGSPSKIVRVTSFIFTNTATAAGSFSYSFNRIFGALLSIAAQNTGFSSASIQKNDLNDPPATAQAVGSYQNDPILASYQSTTILKLKLAVPVTSGSFGGVRENAGVNLIELIGGIPIVLRSPQEGLGIDMDGSTLLGAQQMSYSIGWTEEEKPWP